MLEDVLELTEDGELETAPPWLAAAPRGVGAFLARPLGFEDPPAEDDDDDEPAAAPKDLENANDRAIVGPMPFRAIASSKVVIGLGALHKDSAAFFSV